MADSNGVTGLTLNIVWMGLFLMAMISGYVLLANSEGKGDIFDGYEQFEGFNQNLSTNLIGDIQETSNINNNLSVLYNPELAISAADQSGNAISANMEDLTVGVWNSISQFGGMIFGNIWTKSLSALLASILILLFTAYLIKFIRTGN